MNNPHRTPLAFVVLVIVASPYSGRVYSEEAKRFAAEPVDIEDHFETDTTDTYRIKGDVKWSRHKLTLKPGATVAVAKTLEADLKLEFDLRPGDVPVRGSSVSQVALLNSNNWRIVVTIVRRFHQGRLYRQAIVSQVDGREDSVEKSQLKEVRRLPAFAISGDVERWSLRYYNGLIEISCNGHRLGAAYSESFTSWVGAIAFTQLASRSEISRLRLSGKTAGYTQDQRKLYDRTIALMKQAAAAAARGDLEEAIQLDRSIISLEKQAFGDDKSSIALSHQRIGNRQEILGDYLEAAESHRTASRFLAAAFGAEHPQTLISNLDAASALAKAGKLDEGVLAMRKALAAYLKLAGTTPSTSKTLMTWLSNLVDSQARRAAEKGDYAKALECWREVAEIETKACGADSLNAQNAKFEVDLFSRLLAAEGSQRERMIEYVRLRFLVSQLNAQQKKKAFYAARRDLLQLTREVLGDKHPRTADELMAQATDLSNLGQFDRSAAMLCEAVEIRREVFGEDSESYLHSLGHVGAYFSMHGRYAEATPLLEQACRTLKEHGHVKTVKYAQMKLELGRHLSRCGKYREAAPHLIESLQTYRALGEHANDGALIACERLSDIYRAVQDLDSAEQYMDTQRNLVLTHYGKDNALYVSVLTSEAHHLARLSRFKEAIAKYEEAGALAEKFYGKNSRSYEAIVDGMLRTSLWSGDMPSVVRHFEERLEWELHRRETLFNVYSEREQLGRAQSDLRSLDAILILALEGHLDARRAYNHALAFKGAVAAHQRGERIAASDPEFRQMQEDIHAIEMRLSELENADSTDGAMEGRAELIRRRQEIASNLASHNSAYHTAIRRTRVENLQAAMPRGTVLVDYFEYIKPRGFSGRLFGLRPKLGLVAFVVRDDGGVHLVDLEGLIAVADSLAAWRIAMARERYNALEGSETRLAKATDLRGSIVRQAIWDPLAEHLGDAKTVIISPCPNLTACPFAAIPDESRSRYLIESYAIATIATPRLIPELLADRQPKSDRRLLLVGDIDYGEAPAERSDPDATERPTAFAKLDNAEEELGVIQNAFANRYPQGQLHRMTNSRASESAFRDSMPGADYVHMHTHGFCVVVPAASVLDQAGGAGLMTPTSVVLSGVALADANRIGVAETSTNDGILLTQELARLDFQHADLVTLSACQTALGEAVPGEGMLSAQRALHVAGASSSLTALWAVDDRSTRMLMSAFYRRLWEERLPKAEALQQAMISMLRRRVGADSSSPDHGAKNRMSPALWSGFVLHGDWR